jgi:hypothetical protein
MASCLLAFVLTGIASGAVYVVRTVQTYDGACEKLAGFPGLLQGVGLVSTGNCRSTELRDCKNQPCTVDGKPGHCTVQDADDQDDKKHDDKKHCVCVTKHISK